MKAILTTILLSYAIGSSFASTNPVGTEKNSAQFSNKSKAFEFGVIHIHRQGDGVTLSWNVSDNSVVESFYIQRSYDGSNFLTVGGFSGEANNSWYRYTDAEVFPGFIDYKIVAVLNDGTEVVSTVQSIRILKKK